MQAVIKRIKECQELNITSKILTTTKPCKRDSSIQAASHSSISEYIDWPKILWLNAMHLAQYRVTTVKTIAAHLLFILKPIKAIQLVKHSMCTVLLECGGLRCIFFHMTCRLGTFSLFWRYVWTLNFFFFFFLHDKILFFTYLAKIPFFFQQLISEFSIFDRFSKENRTLDLYSEIYGICTAHFKLTLISLL